MVVHSTVMNLHRICSLERFLCCMELEKGAIALGWFSFIKNFLTMILAVIVIIVRIVCPCTDIIKFLEYFGWHVTLEKCTFVTEEGYATMLATLVIIIYIGLVYISYKFVAATKTRKHKEVIPFMTYLAVMTVTSFLAIFWFSIQTLIWGTVTGLFYGYFLLCVGAMYERFLHEDRARKQENVEANSEKGSIGD